MVIIVEITCDSGSSCDETGRMVVPYGEARALLGGGEDRHHYADSDHDDFDDFDDRYDFFSAVYKYRCNSGLEMDGPDTVFPF